MRIDILTIFPEMFAGPFGASIIKRAVAAGQVAIHLHDIRAFATDRHRSVDDLPYGGGAGMVMRPEPVVAALEAVPRSGTRSMRILLTPQGELLRQPIVQGLAGCDQLILLCGRYEGIDDRVRQGFIDREISIGDYVVSGGEPAAMVVVDAVTRLLPGVLGNAASTQEESHAGGVLEYPHFTRPSEFRGYTVPEVLLSGNHQAIARWRREQSLQWTVRRRPDLLATADLTDAERQYLSTHTQE